MSKKQLIISVVVLIVVSSSIYFFKFFKIEEKTTHCKVVEHHVLANKMGQSMYYTLLSCDDGRIREKEGLYYYSMPKGSSTTISFNILKVK